MKRNVYIKPDDYAALRNLGGGNVSAGVRVALAMAHTMQQDAPSYAQTVKMVALAPVTKEPNQ